MVANNKKGQAMLETILLIPFLVVIIFFIYQAYITVNKVQIVQKQLKASVIGKLVNRYEITSEMKDPAAKNPNGKRPNDGQYFYVYNDYGSDTEGMNSGLDKSTTAVLLTFMRKDQGPSELEARLTGGMVSKQALGICLGGRLVMSDQVDPNVLSMQDDQTCLQY